MYLCRNAKNVLCKLETETESVKFHLLIRTFQNDNHSKYYFQENKSQFNQDYYN